MNTRWLSLDQQRSWRLFLRASAQVLEDVNHDLTVSARLSLPEYEVLVRLSEAPDRVRRMSSLAEDLVHSRSRLTHTVRRLEEAGYVERRNDCEDRRGVNARLTDAGYARLEEAAPGHVEAVRGRLVDRLTTEQMSELGRIMAALLDDDEIDREVARDRPPAPAPGRTADGERRTR
ncbi:MarR family winged helix-turn-helix transcriptional regulator [Georgenia sp. Z1344]|uniref:MarR family winged helix-turn-helix transcriptional regulator n=1 Tax=Georgenia sp. Z1344 TaxID=3416706 RepID=UPI003CF47AB0